MDEIEEPKTSNGRSAAGTATIGERRRAAWPGAAGSGTHGESHAVGGNADTGPLRVVTRRGQLVRDPLVLPSPVEVSGYLPPPVVVRDPTVEVPQVRPATPVEPVITATDRLAPEARTAGPFVPRGPSLSKRISDARFALALKLMGLAAWMAVTAGTAVVAGHAIGWAGVLLAAQGGAWVGIVLTWLAAADAVQLRELKARQQEQVDRSGSVEGEDDGWEPRKRRRS